MKNKIIKISLSILLLTLFFSHLQKSQFFVSAADPFVEGQCLYWPPSMGGAPAPPIVSKATFTASGFLVYQEKAGENCYFPGSCIQGDLPINVTVEDLTFTDPENEFSFTPDKVDFILQKISSSGSVEKAWSQSANIVNNKASVSQNFGEEGKYIAQVSFNKNMGLSGSLTCSIKRSMPFIAAVSCDPDSCSTIPTDPTGNSYDLCLMQINANQPVAFQRCLECFESEGIWTAVGCIPRTPQKIISTLIQIGLVISGAIVLIMILVGAFMLSTSQGDPKKTQDAKELITSAIIGLLFIIFSVTILQFIGASAIKIPGFGE